MKDPEMLRLDSGHLKTKTMCEHVVNPIHDGGGGGGGGQKGPLATSFSSVTYTNVGISAKNFLTFSFKSFPRLV